MRLTQLLLRKYAYKRPLGGVLKVPEFIQQGSLFDKPVERLHIPYVKHERRKIKNRDNFSSEGRLLTVRKHITELFKFERIELTEVRADEVRQYAERLIQIAIQYGDKHRPTMEMADYYIEEKDLIHKLFKVLVPRFQSCPIAFTRTFRLPNIYRRYELKAYPYETFRWEPVVILELRGNPLPPVQPLIESHKNSLLNILLNNASHRFNKEQLQKRAVGSPENNEVEKNIEANVGLDSVDNLKAPSPQNART